MRPVLVALLLTASLTAGCMGGGDDVTPPPGTEPPPASPPPGTEDPDPPEPLTQVRLLTQFNIDGCSGVRLEHSAEASAVQALLPEGYSASVTDGPQPQAHFGVQMYNCTSFTAGSYAFSDVYFGFVWVDVLTPDDGVEGEDQAYIIEMLGEEDVLAEIWPAAGFAIYNGSVRVDDYPFARAISVDEFSLESTKGTPSEVGATGDFAWYHELENGDRLTWTGQQAVAPVDGGAANLIVPDDSGLAPLRSAVAPNLIGEGGIVDAGAFTEMDLVQELAAARE